MPRSWQRSRQPLRMSSRASWATQKSRCVLPNVSVVTVRSASRSSILLLLYASIGCTENCARRVRPGFLCPDISILVCSDVGCLKRLHHRHPLLYCGRKGRHSAVTDICQGGLHIKLGVWILFSVHSEHMQTSRSSRCAAKSFSCCAADLLVRQ